MFRRDTFRIAEIVIGPIRADDGQCALARVPLVSYYLECGDAGDEFVGGTMMQLTYKVYEEVSVFEREPIAYFVLDIH